jgi:lipopolysaccharide transport system ATP-binding protein
VQDQDIAIRGEGLGKRYRIGKPLRYKALRDVLAELFYAPFRPIFRGRNSGDRRQAGDGFIWALKDVSFEIKQGGAVGLIGANGSGKTTLLKILSRIVEPTEGLSRIRGRVGSLLEVGTGFHPELSGRENVYLNGAILGMKRAEIQRKFDEIVAFAEIEKFVDTPVKQYSSGMYIRLAFAVAAHLEPEILLVDEVLAVGDAAFQRRCMDKMRVVTREGRTVVLVSHNIAAVLSLCGKAMLLESGKLVRQGPTGEVVRYYLSAMASVEATPLDERQDRDGDGSARLTAISIQGTDDKVIRSTSRLRITISYRADGALRRPRFLAGIYDYSDAGMFLLDSEAVGGLPDVLPPEGSVSCVTAPINVTPGRCYVNLALLKGGVMADYLQHAARFDIEAEDVYGSGKTPPRDWVLCILKHEWSTV